MTANLQTVLLACLSVAFTASLPAVAQPVLEGYVIAGKACPATPSIRQGGNPGNVQLEPRRAYRLLARNAVPGTHFMIEVPGALPERRWIAMECGTRVATVDEPSPVGDVKVSEPETTAPVGDADGSASMLSEPSTSAPVEGERSTRNILAVSWQAAFCETRPRKDECESQTPERFDASHFSLHGLWPQPRGREYCGVSDAVRELDEASRWTRLPEPELNPETRQALGRVMPGAQSGLDRHEWIRHGTCYGGGAEAYFADSLMLVEAINASPVRTLLAGRLGRTVTLEEVRAAFDEGFGKGAGERVRLSCSRDGDRRLIGEITIGLSGRITSDADVGALIRAARPTKGGCDEGIVDRVGVE